MGARWQKCQTCQGLWPTGGLGRGEGARSGIGATGPRGQAGTWRSGIVDFSWDTGFVAVCGLLALPAWVLRRVGPWSYLSPEAIRRRFDSER